MTAFWLSDAPYLLAYILGLLALTLMAFASRSQS